MTYELPPLPYEYGALEPYMDAATVELHYSKHHKGYADKFNAAIDKHPYLFERTAEDLVANVEEMPSDIRAAVRNFGGGYINHNFFWSIMAPNAGGEASGAILAKIEEDFGSYDEFRKQFTEKATTLFGSGYAWLVLFDGRLEVITTKDQDSPLTLGKKPLLVIDVWEHAYYLKHQNRRNEFIEAWWNLVDWNKVNEIFEELTE